jgi:cytochrome c biogenesis protein CcmG/thiol:disulfide interchange protein DsbE
MKKRHALLPLLAFGVLAAFLAAGLRRDPHELPSPLIGKPAPDFALPRLDGQGGFSSKDMRGQVWLLNVWASWCTACRQEHPVLVEFARTATLPVIGLDYKDQDAPAERWLRTLGNPYKLSAVDADGRVGIDYGVYGVPETYLIDKAGVIRFKQVGPVTPELLQDTLLPMIRELQK